MLELGTPVQEEVQEQEFRHTHVPGGRPLRPETCSSMDGASSCWATGALSARVKMLASTAWYRIFLLLHV